LSSPGYPHAWGTHGQGCRNRPAAAEDLQWSTGYPDGGAHAKWRDARASVRTEYVPSRFAASPFVNAPLQFGLTTPLSDRSRILWACGTRCYSPVDLILDTDRDVPHGFDIAERADCRYIVGQDIARCQLRIGHQRWGNGVCR
jgi:hypothetical protein